MLEDKLSAPFSNSAGTSIEVGWSVGIATAAAGRSNITDVLRQADQEMFAQKAESATQRRAWSTTERAVAQALKENRVTVHYQPLMHLGDEGPTLVGAEALARIESKSGKLLVPADFLDGVKDTEVGALLDQSVIDAAIAQTAQWKSNHLVDDSFKISVNLGPASLRNHDNLRQIADAMDRRGLPGHSLVLEISESANDIDSEGLDWLAERHVEVAIDDLGIERSNLDRLLNTDADYVKLDQRWLLGERERRLEVVTSLVDLVHRLGLTPIAEGVETVEDCQLLRRIGVYIAQGYRFSKPLAANEFIQIAQQWQPYRPHKADTSATRSRSLS